ncbi:restriction endonuclease subunit S [Erythrobacter sp. MTPC3]|uniref:restriction endonuclease subunit S n=1 Tax=Erythrobacter sp. MTPC3 TaxID=3056564 RepID=UPI0036F35EFC
MATAAVTTGNAAWPVVRLGDAVTVVNGGTPKSKVAEYWGGEHQWLTPADMGKMEGRKTSATPRTITSEGLAKSSARLVPPNSVILSTRAPIGHLAINGVPMAFNQGCRGLIPSKDVDYLFLYYFLMANRNLLDDLGSGTTFRELSATNLKSVSMPLPSLDEQKRISAVLDQAFAALDRARANAEANLADSDKLFENWLALIFERQGREWRKVRLPDISENLDRQRVPITKRDRVAGSVPYYGASGVVDHVADYIFDEDLLLVSEDGANLLARTYPIAFSISGKSWVNNHAHVLRFEDRTDQEFVRLYLESISLKPFISGMAQPKLNQKALNKIPIPFPDAATRQDIVEEAERLKGLTTRAVGQYEKALEDINDLRISILSTAFKGRL